MNNVKADSPSLLSYFLNISIGAGLVISSAILALGLLSYGLMNRYQIVSAGAEGAYKLNKASGKTWVILGGGNEEWIIRDSVEEF